MRLTMEMVRLFKGVGKVLTNHMQLSEELLNKSIMDTEGLGQDNRGNNHEQSRKRVQDLKKGSLAYSEYKE